MRLKLNMRKLLLARSISSMPIFIKPVRQDTVVVHGGSGMIEDKCADKKLLGVQTAAHEGYLALKETGNVLDAVERAINIMESDEAFNAGYGSNLTDAGEIELDASIMHGSELSAAGVSVIKDLKHPITLARLVLMKSPYVMLCGEGAMKFAKEQGMDVLPKGSLVTKKSKKNWELTKDSVMAPGELSTVGAVAMSKDGNLAAGTSTGGVMRKLSGQVSDSSGIGAGTYADNAMGAASCTGDSDSITRMCLAYAIVNKLASTPPTEAIHTLLNKMLARLNTRAGAISIAQTGEIGISFNTTRMVWAYQRDRSLCYGINPDEHRESQI